MPHDTMTDPMALRLELSGKAAEKLTETAATELRTPEAQAMCLLLTALKCWPPPKPAQADRLKGPTNGTGGAEGGLA